MTLKETPEKRENISVTAIFSTLVEKTVILYLLPWFKINCHITFLAKTASVFFFISWLQLPSDNLHFIFLSSQLSYSSLDDSCDRCDLLCAKNSYK